MPLFIVLSFLAVSGCSSCRLPGPDRQITLVSYNVMSLFDGVDSGTEYSDFSVRKGTWSKELYLKRVGLVKEAILETVEGGADIVVFQEIENKGVLDAVAESFGANAYPERLFVDETGSAIGTGIMARLPASSFKSHRVVLPSGAPSRPILEAEFLIGEESLTLFACHWKSKSEGARITEPDRVAAACFLASRIAQLERERPGTGIIVAGDLNENADESMRVEGEYPVALTRIGGTPGLAICDLRSSRDNFREGALHSPWLETGRAGEGSYVHEGEWETIDHVLLSASFFDGKGIEYGCFSASGAAELRNANGFPVSWNRNSRTGYSDHLPIVLGLCLVSE